MSDKQPWSKLLGILPNGWSAKKLGQIGRFIRGCGGPKEDETNEGFPCVRYGDLYTYHDACIRDTRSRISADRVHSYTKLNYGDLLFASSGETLEEIGKSAANLMREPAYCGGDVIILRPNVEVSPSYLGHIAESTGSRTQKSRMGRGSTVMHIYADQLRNLIVPVPPIEEQRRIAEILDTVDDTIGAAERVIAKLELTKSGLREHFCAISGPSAVRTKLAELTERIVDCPHSTPDYQSHGVLVARTLHIKNGRFLEANASRVPESTYRDRVTRMTPAAGDVILTREAPVGEAFAIPSGMRICLGQRVVLIRPGPNLLGEFLVELIYSSQGQEAVRRLMAGTTNPHLNVDDIRCLLFEVPSLDEQRRALGVLDALSARIEAESGKLEKLSRIRRGVAADLLSGRVRTVAA